MEVGVPVKVIAWVRENEYESGTRNGSYRKEWETLGAGNGIGVEERVGVKLGREWEWE